MPLKYKGQVLLILFTFVYFIQGTVPIFWEVPDKFLLAKERMGYVYSNI